MFVEWSKLINDIVSLVTENCNSFLSCKCLMNPLKRNVVKLYMFSMKLYRCILWHLTVI